MNRHKDLHLRVLSRRSSIVILSFPALLKGLHLMILLSVTYGII